jgi:hypothetical protein
MVRAAAVRVILSRRLAHQEPAIQAAVMARAQLGSFRPGDSVIREFAAH